MKNCPKCGAMLEDNSRFCNSCGASVTVTNEAAPMGSDVTMPNASDFTRQNASEQSGAKTTPSEPSKGTNYVGVIIGIIFVIIGLVRIFAAGTSLSPETFGADFYTDTYQALVAISEMLAAIEVSLGWVLVAIGAAIYAISSKH